MTRENFVKMRGIMFTLTASLLGFKETGLGERNGFIWRIRTGTDVRFLYTVMNFRVENKAGICWLAEQLSASEEQMCFSYLVYECCT
jgi:hypothetical protein